MISRDLCGAQFGLVHSRGVELGNASGAAQDYAQAEHWYLKAAGQNHPLAHFNLGMMYANGQGAPSDRTKSLVWIQKAAELGDAAAQFRLGETHHRALLDGLPENDSHSRISAYQWFQLAAAQGYRGAESACEVMNLEMTREDVVEGGRRIAKFNAARMDEAKLRTAQVT